MSRVVSIGVQDFEKIIFQNYFYVDKTMFIREWWESGDDVTLITRPRRFGKTLTMSMLERFWSIQYRGQGDLFCGLKIWEEEKYRELQGTYPVISLSFANVKENTYPAVKRRLCQILTDLYNRHAFLLESDLLTQEEERYFRSVRDDMDETTASLALHRLSDYLHRFYGRKVIILLDEYDTPMQEAYVNGYWQDLTVFAGSLFNSSFKTNPHLERAVMTGITRVSRESVFSDLNNLKVITTTSHEYAEMFGFTEQEVFAAMDEMGYTQKEQVRSWYDGFTFGKTRDIYNPWSVINFLDTGELKTYWANTSANTLVSRLIREGGRHVKEQFETLLRGGAIESVVDEEIVYNQLERDETAIWSLLLASGYLKVAAVRDDVYRLELTNYEVKRMFGKMIRGWFDAERGDYNDFIRALLTGDLESMNGYMSRMALSLFSFFDGGTHPSGASQPERFYHGFVLGLLVELSDRYVITSNRESGFGRYDVMLEPLYDEDDALILEFKVRSPKTERSLQETAKAALRQIEDRRYETVLTDRGIPLCRIRKYGLAFEGKQVCIGQG